MSEPFYIRQTAEPMTQDQRRDWFQTCAQEAKAEGAQHARFTIHPAFPSLCLVEAWKERVVADEGEPRWAIRSADKGGEA